MSSAENLNFIRLCDVPSESDTTRAEDAPVRHVDDIAAEVFRRILAHPEGVEVARVATDTNLIDHLGFDDKRIRLAPAPMLTELARALATPPAHDASYPFVLAAGLRTRWTANTIQRDSRWRKGRGPHCALNVSPGDAKRLSVGAARQGRLPHFVRG